MWWAGGGSAVLSQHVDEVRIWPDIMRHGSGVSTREHADGIGLAILVGCSQEKYVTESMWSRTLLRYHPERWPAELDNLGFQLDQALFQLKGMVLHLPNITTKAGHHVFVLVKSCFCIVSESSDLDLCMCNAIV